MYKIYQNEVWKEIEMPFEVTQRYAVSNFGRVVSYVSKIKDGRLLKGSITEGYKILRFKKVNPQKKKIENKHIFVHHIVASCFVKNNNPEATEVIFLDFNKQHIAPSNLKWVSKKEVIEHHKKNPLVIEAKQKLQEHNLKRSYKLTSTKVMMIKKILSNPNRRITIKKIALNFGVSDMQILRIKRGENWSHVKI